MATHKNIIPNESLSPENLSSVSSSPNILPSFLSSGPSLNTKDVSKSVDSTQRSDPSIDEALERLVLSDKGATQMFTLIGALFQRAIEQGQRTDLDVEDWRSLLQRADESSRHGQPDIDALRLIRKILACLWSSKSEEIVEATKLLADRSRELEWRLPFGQAGILDFFLELIATEEIDLEMEAQILRLIGNACADTDMNRETVIARKSLPIIIGQLQHTTLANLAIPVLYNICFDYEPAQQTVRSTALGAELTSLLATAPFNTRPLLSYICSLLSYTILESADADRYPDSSVQTLFQTALQPDVEVDDLAALVNATITLLKLERFQLFLIHRNLVKLPLLVIIRSFSPRNSSNSSLSVVDLEPLVRDPEEEDQLSAIRNALIRTLSDVSALPEFGIQHPLDSSLVQSLLLWLSASRAHFQVCACIMLGNLARSDTVCQIMVNELRIHEILATILKDSSDLQALHSVLGFLRNLALPAENKPLLGDAQVIEAASRFLVVGFSSQLQHAALGLIRQLLIGSLVNVQRLLAPLSPDPDSPAHEKTYLSLLLSLFDKTDREPTKMEIARMIAAIWRCLNATDHSLHPDDLSRVIHRLFSMHATVAAPLAMMVIQSRWPVVRSEGWFALALMARSPEGSAAINGVLQQVEVFGALVETVTGQPIAVSTESASTATEEDDDFLMPESARTGRGTEQEREMQRRNRENAMVLINELLKNSGDGMPSVRRSVLEDLLHGRSANPNIQELILRAQLLE